ncbi:hypothetical protein DFS34DRAFT_96737 [Phlyctochytrium arcticum]|nr:hypothetical protein DFS34DRAFT_335181 [Phlyctochytrium arcticum]KAI9098066.1 hypothetical protein DFS34DRAFT_96737 [Phlyctochytrium arcticum]
MPDFIPMICILPSFPFYRAFRNMLKLDPSTPWEDREAILQRKFLRTRDSSDPDGQFLGEQLADVVIEVYPDADATEVEADETADTTKIAVARIPAHSVILANGSKYFHTLFTNGMAQSKMAKAPQADDGVGSKDISPSDRRPVLVKIKGHPVHIVRYFIRHLYNSRHATRCNLINRS